MSKKQEKPKIEQLKQDYKVTLDKSCITLWERPDGTQIETREELLCELKSLLIRCIKIEDYVKDANKILDLHQVPKIDPTDISKDLTLGERIEWLSGIVEGWVTRAEKAKADLESTKKMADHWEAKAQERQAELNEWKARAEKAEAEMNEANKALDLIAATKLRCGRPFKLMTTSERVQWVSEGIDDLTDRAKKAEADLERFANMPSCSPELFLRSSPHAVNPEPIDWQRVRIEAAIAAMQGLLTSPNVVTSEIFGSICVNYADALISELKKEVAE